MIGKVMKNTSYRGTVGYVLTKADAELIGGNMDGETVEELTREFMLSYDLHPDIERPVYHFSLSYSPQDKATQDFSDERLAEIATRHFAGMVVSFRCYDQLKAQDIEAFNQQVDRFMAEELGEYQFLVAIHRDRDHVHTHTIASRINLLTGKCIETWQDQLRSQKVIRTLEQTYGLEPVKSSWEVGRKARTKGQLEQHAAGAPDTAKAQVQAAIDRLTAETPGIPITTLVSQLQAEGIQAQVTYLSTGRPRGVSYECDGVAMAGGKLGKRYTFPGGLATLGVTYIPERDDAVLQQWLERSGEETLDSVTVEPNQAEAVDIPQLVVPGVSEPAVPRDIERSVHHEQVIATPSSEPTSHVTAQPTETTAKPSIDWTTTKGEPSPSVVDLATPLLEAESEEPSSQPNQAAPIEPTTPSLLGAQPTGYSPDQQTESTADPPDGLMPVVGESADLVAALLPTSPPEQEERTDPSEGAAPPKLADQAAQVVLKKAALPRDLTTSYASNQQAESEADSLDDEATIKGENPPPVELSSYRPSQPDEDGKNADLLPPVPASAARNTETIQPIEPESSSTSSISTTKPEVRESFDQTDQLALKDSTPPSASEQFTKQDPNQTQAASPVVSTPGRGVQFPLTDGGGTTIDPGQGSKKTPPSPGAPTAEARETEIRRKQAEQYYTGLWRTLSAEVQERAPHILPDRLAIAVVVVAMGERQCNIPTAVAILSQSEVGKDKQAQGKEAFKQWVESQIEEAQRWVKQQSPQAALPTNQAQSQDRGR